MRGLLILVLFSFLLSCSGTQEKATKQDNETKPAETLSSVGEVTLKSVQDILESYEKLRDAFVEYDTTAVNQMSAELLTKVDNTALEGVKDSAQLNRATAQLSQISNDVKAIKAKTDLIEKKRAFSSLSSTLFAFLKEIQYNKTTVYQQACPMAFNDSEEASWVSSTSKVVNPYLGKKHPKYAAGMLSCGEIKDSVSAK